MAAAQSHWVQLKSGPFELATDAGGKHGREMLGWFDQLRYVLGYMLGNQDLHTSQPIRILLFKNGQERGAYPTMPAVIEGRDRYGVLLAADATIPREVFRDCTRLFLENNAGRMPPGIERGIADVLSTIQVNGTHVTLGAPLPPNERNRDWARLHYLVASWPRTEPRAWVIVMLSDKRFKTGRNAISVMTALTKLPPRVSIVPEKRIVSSCTRCEAPSMSRIVAQLAI